MVSEKHTSADKFLSINSFVHVIWGEEQAPIPALVTEVTERGFKALIRPEGAEANLGPFNFYFSDLDWKGAR